MTIERAVFAFLGFMILMSVGLTQWVNPLFVWLTVLLGVNLFQFAFTRFCPAAMIFKAMGMKYAGQN